MVDIGGICERLDLIGNQLAKLLELERVTAGRNPYDPILVDLSAQTQVDSNYPSEGGSQIEFVTITTDTATVITISVISPNTPAAGKVIAKFNLPANVQPAPVPLNYSVPPVPGTTLRVAASVQPVKAFAVFTLSGAEGGRYPYVD